MSTKKVPSLQNYEIGYIGKSRRGSLSKAYKVRSNLARPLGAMLYSIPMTRENLELLQKKDKLKVRYWNGDSVEELTINRPVACHDLTSHKRPELVTKILELMTERGTSFVSNWRLRDSLADKWTQYQLLHRSGISVPRTSILSKSNLADSIDQYETVFIKPRIASQGKGQVTVQKLKESYNLLRSGTTHKKSFDTYDKLEKEISRICISQQSYIIQRGVDVDMIDGRVYDFRVVYQRSRHGRVNITGCYIRVGPRGFLQANIGQKGHPQDPALVFKSWNELRKRIATFGRKVFKAFDFGLGEAGIDIVMTKEGDLVCIEINTRPGSKGFQIMREIVSDDLYHKTKQVIPYKYNNKRRTSWGQKLKKFRTRPILFCMYLIDQSRKTI